MNSNVKYLKSIENITVINGLTAFELVSYKKGPFRRVVVVVFEEKVDGKDLYGVIDETIEGRELQKECFFSVKNAIKMAKGLY